MRNCGGIGCDAVVVLRIKFVSMFGAPSLAGSAVRRWGEFANGRRTSTSEVHHRNSEQLRIAVRICKQLF